MVKKMQRNGQQIKKDFEVPWLERLDIGKRNI